MSYEMVIGLETHIELLTKTKIFCSCSALFSKAANTHCCPVCTGLPGTLPTLNRAVVDFAAKAGIATNCRIANISKMDRKNYVYPDLCKAYQISQFDMPICSDGHLTLSDGHKIRINRIHIEEDAGKLIHENGKTLIDYNRGGVALIEIVTEPDFKSAVQVKEYLEELRLIMKTIGISDCKMQEGSMRCDVNISVRKSGDITCGERTEIKNVNSFSFITKAIELEFSRQVSLLESGFAVTAQTMRYDGEKNELSVMRGKETSDDYRYFPEPDILNIYISNERLERLKKEIPELPSAKRKRFINDYNISPADAGLIVKYTKLSDYLEAMIKESGKANLCTNILLNFLFKFMETEEAKENAELNISAKDAAFVAEKLASGEILNSSLKRIFDTMHKTGKSFSELFDISEFAPIAPDKLEAIVDEVILQNPEAVSAYKSGKQKAVGSLMGSVMKKTGGKADAKSAESLILKKLNQTRGKLYVLS